MSFIPSSLVPTLERIASILRAHNKRLAVFETTTGGLVSAYLLAQPGASKFFASGAVLYNLDARRAWAGWTDETVQAYRGPNEELILWTAENVRKALNADFGFGESGIAGPKSLVPDKPVGTTFLALSGAVERTKEARTGLMERAENMEAFAAEAVRFILGSLEEWEGGQKKGAGL